MMIVDEEMVKSVSPYKDQREAFITEACVKALFGPENAEVLDMARNLSTWIPRLGLRGAARLLAAIGWAQLEGVALPKEI